MKIGVLGGTFDPVHNAHLAMARAAVAALGLDKILFIPTGAPKYRKPATASAAQRLAMLRLALQGNPHFTVDERELSPAATGYTVDTLRALREELGPAASLYLLIGADQHEKLAEWHRPQEIARLAEIRVFARPGSTLAARDSTVIPMPLMPLSASDIRARAAAGKDVSDAVPPAVASYIARERPYR